MGVTLEEFTPAHIAAATGLSAEAGWPHRREDWAMVLGLSQGVVALEGPRVVGTAMMTPFGTAAAAINMVIVDAALRGRGLGRRLMDYCLALAAGRECRLTATAEGLPLYEKLGFRAIGTVAQHQGVVRTQPRVEDVAWCGAEQEAVCLAMDREATGLDRHRLLAVLFAQGRVAMIRGGDRITGFIFLRRFGRGEVAGPLIADTVEDARALLSFVFSDRKGAFLRVDTSEPATLGVWLTEQGLVKVDTGVAMSTGPSCRASSRFHPFALASQALG